MGLFILIALLFFFFRFVYRQFYTTFAASEIAKRNEKWGNVGKWIGGLSSYRDDGTSGKAS